MLSYRVFYGGLTIEDGEEIRLGLTPEDSVKNGYELFKLLEGKFSAGHDLLFKLPDRRRQGTEKPDRRAVFVPRIADYTESGVIIFDFWKVHYDLDDRKIFDEAVRKVDRLKDLLTLRETQGALIECACAYDYSTSTIIWRDIDGVSKSDLEFFLFRILKRKVKINYLYDTRSDADFALIDLESLSLDVETANSDAIARALTSSPLGRAGIAGKLADIIEESDAGRIQFKLLADRGKTANFLRKETLQQDIGTLREFLALANVNRKQSNYRGRLRAEGRIPNRFTAIEGAYENRVIDLFQGLLIKKLEIDESEDPEEQQRILDSKMLQFIRLGRESRDVIQNASSL